MIQILTPEEVAAIMKRPHRTIIRMCASGQLPGARKAGRCWRIPETAVDAFFAAPAPPEQDAPHRPAGPEESIPDPNFDRKGFLRRLRGEGPLPPGKPQRSKTLSDTGRARARAALRRLGVSLPEPTAGRRR